jgi:uncharacterized membrane protein
MIDAFDFNFIVLPLGILVFALVAAIILISQREEIAHKRKTRRIDAYLKEKAKQRQLLDKELADLGQLLRNKSIDEDTYKRLKTLVEMNEEKQEKTVDLLDEIKMKE